MYAFLSNIEKSGTYTKMWFPWGDGMMEGFDFFFFLFYIFKHTHALSCNQKTSY